MQGIGKDGKRKDTYARGMALRAKTTLFAEGCRGNLSESLMAKFNLREGVPPQTYGLGLKEIWEIPEEKHRVGYCCYCFCWCCCERWVLLL